MSSTTRVTIGDLQIEHVAGGACGGRGAAPIPPPGLCLPPGSGPGGLALWDGFNWTVLTPPTTPGAVLTWGLAGPYWANP